MNLIDGKAVSASVKEQIRAEIERDKLDIGLAVIIVGNNQASRVYVNNKKKACEVCGIKSYESTHCPKIQRRTNLWSLSTR